MKAAKEKQDLSCVRFTLLGLGSTDYSTFMGAPTFIHKTLTHLKATFFYQFGKADEATSLEKVIEPWKAGVWNAIEKEFEKGVVGKEGAVSTHSVDDNIKDSDFKEAKIIDK